jgi:hypothetical protein
MADQAELAFARTFVATLGSLPVHYPDDYVQPPSNALRKLPVVPVRVLHLLSRTTLPLTETRPQIDLPPPPARLPAPAASSSAAIALTIKSLKPAASFSVSASPADSVAALKALLAAQPRAPPADAQRLLLKGKALADAKLLRDYDVADGATLTLSLKPGTVWDPSAAPPPAPKTMPAPTPLNTSMAAPPSPGSLSPRTPSPPLVALTMPPPEPDSGSGSGAKKRGHSRIPSVVLSPSPSGGSPGAERPADIPLTFDTTAIPTASEQAGPPKPMYHATVADPAFWERMYAFLR